MAGRGSHVEGRGDVGVGHEVVEHDDRERGMLGGIGVARKKDGEVCDWYLRDDFFEGREEMNEGRSHEEDEGGALGKVQLAALNAARRNLKSASGLEMRRYT